jgi:hypothetical protein
MDNLDKLSDELLQELIDFGKKWLAKDPEYLIDYLRTIPDRKVWNKKVEKVYSTFLAEGPQDNNQIRSKIYDAAVRQIDEEYIAKFNAQFSSLQSEKAKRDGVFDKIKPVCPRSFCQDDDNDDNDAVIN